MIKYLTTTGMVIDTQSAVIIPTYTQLFEDIGDITKEIYIIFAAFMISKIIIKEYRDGTIQVLFTYPISRPKLIRSKIILIMLFTSIVVAISTVLNLTLIYLISEFTGFITVSLTADNIIKAASLVFINASLCSFLGMIPLFIAIKRKSESLMIFLAFIIISVDEVIVLEQLIVLASFGIISILLSLWRINKLDVKT